MLLAVRDDQPPQQGKSGGSRRGFNRILDKGLQWI